MRDAVEKMAMHNIGSIPVVDEEQRILGMFTERDLVRLMAERGAQALEAKLGEVMTRKLVIAHPDDPIPKLAHKMLEHGIRHLPVVDENGRLLGVVSIRRVLRHLMAGNEWP